MFQHNNPNAHRNIHPNDPSIISGPELSRSSVRLKNGLYYRCDIDLSLSEVEDRLSTGRDASILDFQYYAESAWKTEHGTSDSMRRFTSKVDEEHDEIIEALGDMGKDTLSLQVDYDDIELESGDLLWCLAALASNGGADIDAGLKNLLFRYVCGTQWVRDLQPLPPPWRQRALEMAGKYEPITFTNISDLLDAEFEPAISPIMNIHDPEPDEETVSDHQTNLLMWVLAAQQIARRQYGEGDGFSSHAQFEVLARELGEVVAGALLEIAFINSRTTGASLSRIVTKNVLKLNDRVSSNQIDKTDRVV